MDTPNEPPWPSNTIVWYCPLCRAGGIAILPTIIDPMEACYCQQPEHTEDNAFDLVTTHWLGTESAETIISEFAEMVEEEIEEYFEWVEWIDEEEPEEEPSLSEEYSGLLYEHDTD